MNLDEWNLEVGSAGQREDTAQDAFKMSGVFPVFQTVLSCAKSMIWAGLADSLVPGCPDRPLLRHVYAVVSAAHSRTRGA